MTATRNGKSPFSGLSANLIHKPGRSQGIKAYKSDDGRYGWVEGYLVSWGNSQDTDLQGEFFSPRTEFCLDWFKERPVLYHHGLDGQSGLRKIGVIKSVETDELGLWVQAQLDLRDRYSSAVYDMVKSKEFGWSSGSVDHLVKIAESGEIATWPLIEGSITPTPAQPSKTAVRAMKGGTFLPPVAQLSAPTTSYRAFKAILEGDTTNSSFVRGLDARVRSGIGNTRYTNSTKSLLSNRDNSRFRSRASSRRLAYRGDSMLDEETAIQIAEDMETDAILASLEEDMTHSNTEDITMARSTRRSTRRRRARRDDMAYGTENELAMQMDSIASDVADSIAADIEDEVKANLDEAKAEDVMVRKLRRRALRKAMRQLDATDDISAAIPGDPGVITGGVGGEAYYGDLSDENPPIENFKRTRRSRRARPVRRNTRRRASRTNDPVAMDEIRQTEDAIMTEVVAERSYRNGFRNGARRGMRTTDEITTPVTVIHEDNSEVGNFDEVSASGGDITTAKRRRRSLRRNGRRGIARRNDGSYAGEVDAYSADEEGGAARSFRRGYRAALRRAKRSGDEESFAMEDEKALRRRRRARRNDDLSLDEDKALRRRRRASRMDDLDAVSMDEEKALRRRSRARRNDDLNLDEDKALRRRRRARRTDDVDAVSMDEEKALRRRSRARRTDDVDAVGMDEEKALRRRSRKVRGKSASIKSDGYGGQAQYWRNRAMKAELTEAPNQRSFGRMRVKDSADRPGAYSNAFKSYLYQGLGLLSDSEKYTLKGKGRVNWGATKGTFAAPGQGALKTYFGGSDASAGFAVPPDWVAELNKNIMTQTVMAPECRTRTTTSDRIVQPNLITTDARRTHAAEVRWPGEVITDTSSHRSVEDTYSQIDVPIHVMLMSLTAGNSALEDVSFSLEDEINEAFSEATAIAYDELIWSGDGQGKLQGIVVNNLVTGSRSTNMQTVGGYVPTGSPDGIVTADSLKEMLFHLPRGYRQRSKWYMNSNTGLQIATLKDGNGNYLIDQRDESLQAVGVPDRLLGKPIVYNEYADDIVADGFPIVLGDLSRGYLIGKRVDFSIRRFDDSQYAELDQVLFLGRARIGGQVLQPASMKTLKISAT